MNVGRIWRVVLFVVDHLDEVEKFIEDIKDAKKKDEATGQGNAIS